MRATRIIRGAAAIVTILLAACSGDAISPTAPSAAPSPTAGIGSAASSVVVPVLAWSTPLAEDVSTSAVIGPRGGLLWLRETGLVVVVPRGAVAEPMTFRVTAVAGDVVAYEFEPHGVRFAVPLEATQNLRGTNWWRGSASEMELGYFSDRAVIDEQAHEAAVEERYPTKVFYFFGPKLHFEIPHFSGYIISTAGTKPR